MDATLKEINIWRSVKKFFSDGISEVPVYFDRIITAPSADAPERWVNVIVEDLAPNQVSSAIMNVYMFSKNDHEGDKLAQLRDTVLELLFPGSIDLYDTTGDSWVKVGGMVIRVDGQSKAMQAPDGSKMSYITTTLKWGAVW
jgi:hypothetical protein